MPHAEHTFFRRPLLALLVLSLGGAAGCRPQKTRVDALCSFDVVSQQELESKALDPMTWLTIVSPGIDRIKKTRTGAVLGACGLVHEPLAPDFACKDFDGSVRRVAGDTIDESDLIMSQLGNDRTLLWAATDELEGGEAEGAAALTVWSDAGLEIHAVGSLRGYRQSARVKLHSVDGMPVLLLESDRCDAAGRCDRVVQPVPIIERRIRELPLYDENRGCLGRAQFVLTKKAERPLPAGWVRRFELQRSIELVEGGGLTLIDLIVAKDHDSRNPDTPPRPVRRINAKRPLQIRDGRWELTEEDLWERVVRDDGIPEAAG